MDFSIIFGNLDIYFEGLKNTLILVSISLVIGLIFAVPLAVLRTSKNLAVSGPIQAYVYCCMWAKLF